MAPLTAEIQIVTPSNRFQLPKPWISAKGKTVELASCHLIEVTKKHKGPGVL